MQSSAKNEEGAEGKGGLRASCELLVTHYGDVEILLTFICLCTSLCWNITHNVHLFLDLFLRILFGNSRSLLLLVATQLAPCFGSMR